jgi:dynein heavy chain
MIRTLIESLQRMNIDLLYYTLNPKALGINHMFGQVNPLTNEWHDGIVSTLVRHNMRDKRLTYLVFDGPVDAIWVENMNTVLDDNRMLCLPNGERIKVYRDLTLLFEVDHLK